MNKAFLMFALAAGLAVGCGDTDSTGTGGAGGTGGVGGTGGTGGTIGPLTWTTPGLTVVGDDCEFFADEAAEYEMTIEGSTVTLVNTDPEVTFVLTADDYSPTQDEVRVTGVVENDTFLPCVVELGDAFRLELDDPDVSLDQNDTVQVTWDHSETDVSDMVGDCAGEWFVPLPCAGQATFTLTQQFD